jgi:hypothetical protein
MVDDIYYVERERKLEYHSMGWMSCGRMNCRQKALRPCDFAAVWNWDDDVGGGYMGKAFPAAWS